MNNTKHYLKGIVVNKAWVFLSVFAFLLSMLAVLSGSVAGQTQKPSSYSEKKYPNQGIIDEGNTVLRNDAEASGYYTLRNSDGSAMVNGSIVFQSNSPITDYNFATLVSNIGWNGIFSFSASKDGQTWDELMPEVKKTSDHPNSAWGAAYYDNYGTLNAADGYRYLRATVSGAEIALPFPALGYVEYNTSGPAKPSSYSEKKYPNQGIIDEGNTVLRNDAEASGYYTLRNSDGTTMVDGSIVFQSSAPITDYNFATLVSTGGWNGTFSFYASKDGQTWDELMPEVKKTSDHPNGAWGAAYYDNYGTLSEAAGYRYLRATVSGASVALPFPALGYVEYNTQLPPKADNYQNKKLPTEGTVEGGALKKETEDIANGYYTLRNSDGSALVSGSIIFRSNNPITDYNFSTIVSDNWNGNFAFSASKDGNTWVELSPFVVKVAKTSNPSWGETYKCDNYGTLSESDGYRYLKVSVTTSGNAVPFPSLGYVEYNTNGLPEGVLEESENIDDLSLPSSPTDFSAGHRNGIFKTSGMTVTANASQNIDWIGGAYGLVALQDTPCDVIMYTPNVRDFTFRVAYSKDWKEVVIRAYGRSSQYGEETEIPLIRTANLRTEQGFPHYLFRPANRSAMPQNFEYIRIEFKNGIYCQIMNFTFFYDGSEPGEVPQDEQNQENPNGTDRENVISYNFVKNNFPIVRSENFGSHDTGTNADYIGVKKGFVVYPYDDQDAYMVLPTQGITKFYVKVNTLRDRVPDLVVKFFVSPSDNPEDESNYVEIPVKYEFLEKQPENSPWCAIEYITADDAVIPEGSKYLKILIPGSNMIGTNFLLSRVDFEYSLPDVEPLPDFRRPDASKGEKEMMEDLSGTQLLARNGGKAEDMAGIDWTMRNLGSMNGEDKVLVKTNLYDESYLIYKLNDVSFIDIRGYRHKDCQEDLIVSVSKDGKNWVELKKFERLESELYGGPVKYSHRIATDDIPAGMNYVKIEIPELSGEISDLTISDIQILYNLVRTSNGGDSGSPSPNTGSTMPATALMLSAVAAAFVMTASKKRSF